MQIDWEKILISTAQMIALSTPYFEIAWRIFLNWWWLILPLILWKHTLFFWLWWRNEIWDSKQKNVILEIRIPRDNPKPMRAMESIFTGLWQIWAAPNWIEKWWDGQYLLSYSFDIVAIDGNPHFLIRCHKSAKGLVETHIYSQFPEAEVFEVEDYTKKVPQDMPNKEWDFWGTDYKLLKESCYPIRTYKDFEPKEDMKEEKRIDPMSSLLEGMGSLKKGEQIWVQIKAKPILDEVPWVSEGKKIIDKLVNRKLPPKSTSIIEDVINGFMGNLSKKEEKKDDLIPPEMKLTPGERDIVSGVENKISKFGYQTFIRYIYLAKKDVMVKPNLRLPMSYFTNFGTNNLNGLAPDGRTLSKIRKKWYDPFWFPKRRLYLKKRKMFRKYITRLPYDYPLSGGTFVLNVEELATIYHFPSRILTPASQIPRVEAKKGEAPLELPVED